MLKTLSPSFLFMEAFFISCLFLNIASCIIVTFVKQFPNVVLFPHCLNVSLVSLSQLKAKIFHHLIWKLPHSQDESPPHRSLFAAVWCVLSVNKGT